MSWGFLLKFTWPLLLFIVVIALFIGMFVSIPMFIVSYTGAKKIEVIINLILIIKSEMTKLFCYELVYFKNGKGYLLVIIITIMNLYRIRIYCFYNRS